MRGIGWIFLSGLLTGAGAGFALGVADYDSGQRKLFLAACEPQLGGWECLERWNANGPRRRFWPPAP